MGAANSRLFSIHTTPFTHQLKPSPSPIDSTASASSPSLPPVGQPFEQVTRGIFLSHRLINGLLTGALQNIETNNNKIEAESSSASPAAETEAHNEPAVSAPVSSPSPAPVSVVSLSSPPSSHSSPSSADAFESGRAVGRGDAWAELFPLLDSLHRERAVYEDKRRLASKDEVGQMKELSAAIDELDARRFRVASKDLACESAAGLVLGCYRANPGQPLVCGEFVQQYKECAEKAKKQAFNKANK